MTALVSCYRARSALLIGAAAAACLLASSCLHRRGAAMVLLVNQNKLMIRGDCPSTSATCSPLNPTEADRYASQQYDSYGESGFVTMQPGMRLRIVAPIMRPGSAEPVAGQPAVDGPGGGAITLKSSPNLLGYETAMYIMRAETGGALTVELDTLDLKPAGKVDPATLKSTDYLKDIQPKSFLRLYFQLRHSMKDHSSALLVSDSQGRLNEASGKFEEKPDDFCAAPDTGTRCILIPKLIAVNAEIRVFVGKDPVYLPLSATVADALKASGIDEPRSVVERLKIRRQWNSHLVPVKFSDAPSMALRLPLVGGDRITF